MAVARLSAVGGGDKEGAIENISFKFWEKFAQKKLRNFQWINNKFLKIFKNILEN